MTLQTETAGEITTVADIDRLEPLTLAKLYAELTGDPAPRVPRALVRRHVAAWLAVAADIRTEVEPKLKLPRRPRKPIRFAPGPRLRRTNAGSAAARLVCLLGPGATFEALMQALGRPARLVRNLLTTLRWRTGYGVVEGKDGLIRLVAPRAPDCDAVAQNRPPSQRQNLSRERCRS